ncbi:hypothetical protein ABT093_30510 [Kitasatospora sp. NPDC002551]|uniref:hypothetical protein n=1 Tax=Kitasatospora sp. NPDC002551 TaxID=3154539 RepID=UPI00331DA796
MRRKFDFDAETRTTTCRTCWRSGSDTATEEEAKVWHAGHRCPPPAPEGDAKILPLRPRQPR